MQTSDNGPESERHLKPEDLDLNIEALSGEGSSRTDVFQMRFIYNINVNEVDS